MNTNMYELVVLTIITVLLAITLLVVTVQHRRDH